MEFLLIAVAHFLALLSPGPDFFLIMQAALRLPRRCSFALCSGIAAANGVYAGSAVAGLELIRGMYPLASAFKYLGAAYLVFLGVMLLRSRERMFQGVEVPSFLQTTQLSRQFLVGFSAAIVNPKNGIFYMSLFTAMVAVDTPMLLRIFYGIWMTGMVFCWDCLVVMFIGRDSIKIRLGRGIFYLEKCSGAMLALFGVTLPFV